jgi:hypothetical protein
MPKSYFRTLKQSCPVGFAGCAMMMVMITGAGAKGLFHIGRDFSTGQRMWQGFDIIYLGNRTFHYEWVRILQITRMKYW